MNDLTEKALHAAEQCMSDVYEYYKNGVSNTVMDEAMKSLKNDGLKLVKQARAALTPPAAVSAAGAAGWVSVTDRLPEPSTDVLVWPETRKEGVAPHTKVYVAEYNRAYPADQQPAYWQGEQEWWDVWEITHWQPIPGPPAAPAPAAPTTTAPQS